ncbi:MAG: chromosome partitioning protein ParB [Snowella sp.]|nr:MAG: chromosome partitioning protein ParB [Snowella sp.]
MSNSSSRKQDKPYKVQANLDDLLGAETISSSQKLPLTMIVLPESQPRRYFDPEKLDQLAESIKTYGVLENLLVRPLSEQDDKYELVAGERRYRAAKAAGLTEVPVSVRDLTHEEALEISLIENLQREDLNPIEETEGILSLLSVRLQKPVSQVILLLYQMLNARTGKITNNVISNEQSTLVQAIFQEVGCMNWESFVSNRLPLLKLPIEILEALRQGKIEYTKATAIAKVKDETQRAELLKESIQNSLSLTQIKERIAILKPSPDLLSPKNQLQTLTRRLNQLKLWEKDKKTWKKVEGLLGKIEMMLTDVETEV